MDTQSMDAQANGAVLEFQVHDLEDAISYYGEVVADQVIEGIERTAHVHLEDAKIILRETYVEETKISQTG